MTKLQEHVGLSTSRQAIPDTQPTPKPQVEVPADHPDVVAVVVNWNRREDTLACLASLHELAYPGRDDRRLRVLLVDNGSSDGTVGAVEAQFPETEIISLSQNLGFAAGCNVGLRRALASGADYVLLVNNDAIVAPDMLEQLVSVAELRPEAGLIGPVIYRLSPDRFENALGKPRLSFYTVDAVWSAGHRERPITLSSQPPAGRVEDGVPYEVDRLYGAGLLIRRQVLEEVGLFDERFFMYYEDADLSRRARQAGYRLLVVPKAQMWHKVAASTGEANPVLWYHMARSSVLFFGKHTPGWLLLLVFVYRFAVAIKKFVLAARHGRWDVLQAYSRGLVAGLRLLSDSSRG